MNLHVKSCVSARGPWEGRAYFVMPLSLEHPKPHDVCVCMCVRACKQAARMLSLLLLEVCALRRVLHRIPSVLDAVHVVQQGEAACLHAQDACKHQYLHASQIHASLPTPLCRAT